VRNGTVQFDDVSFAYGARNGNSAGLTLDGLNLHVPGGYRVALVGRSGAGKTTMASLIPRFYEATRGRVLIDGRDVRHYTLKSLREHVALVAQDALLFSASIRDNLRYARPEATDEMLLRAIEMASLREFVESLPDGRGKTLLASTRGKFLHLLSDTGDRCLTIPSTGTSLANLGLKGKEPATQIRQCGRGLDRAVTRDDMLRLQLFQAFQGLNPVRHAPARRHRWNNGVEEEIAGKQGARLGQPRDAIARTVRPGKIEQLHLNITNEQGNLILEGQRRRSNDHIAYKCCHTRILTPTSKRLLSMGNHVIPYTFVRDNRAIRKYLVPIHMIAMGMRIKKGKRPIFQVLLRGSTQRCCFSNSNA
jgi:ABC-type sugar transport system ATPase subunit